MKFRKRFSERFKKGVAIVKKYMWRTLFIITICVGAYTIGRPLIALIRTNSEIDDLEEQQAIYKESIRRDSIEIERLKNDEYLEQYAREKYFMQGKNEQVFIVE